MGQRLQGHRLALVALSVLLLPGQSFGGPTAADNSLPLFENLLGNATGIAANLEYAQSLQAAGQIDEARRIYSTVLGLDPNNETAIAALATLNAQPLPAQTDYTLRWGGAFETNSPRRPPTFSTSNADGMGFGELTVNDTRQLGDITLQSNFDVYSNIHTKFPSVDISYAALDTGPIIDLNSSGKLRVAVGGEYLLQGSMVAPDGGHGTRRFTFDSANIIFNYFPP